MEVSIKKEDKKEKILQGRSQIDKSCKGLSNSMQVILDFIINHKDVIEPKLYSEALNLNDDSISAALWKIHQLTLNRTGSPIKFNDSSDVKPAPSYKQALLSSSKPFTEGIIASPGNSFKPKLPVSNTIFFFGFPDNMLAKDIWHFFKKGGRIKDLILPKRRDKNNNRYGFVLFDDSEDGSKFLVSLKGRKLGGVVTYLAFAKINSVGLRKSPMVSNSKPLLQYLFPLMIIWVQITQALRC